VRLFVDRREQSEPTRVLRSDKHSYSQLRNTKEKLASDRKNFLMAMDMRIWLPLQTML
jgi:hypothetical protein